MVRERVNNFDNAGGGAQEWFQSLPIVTQYWFGLTLLLTFAGNMGMVSPMNFVLIWENVKHRFEIWRLLTSFCYAGSFSFPTLMLLYLLMSFSQRYESSGPFNTGAGGGSADYLFMLIFGAVTMMVTQPLMNMIVPISGMLMCGNLIHYVVYIWSKRHPATIANIWGIPFKAVFVPFVNVVIALFMGNPYLYIIHGIIVGHIYYFLVDVVPHVYGKDVLTTPQFLIDQMGVGIYAPPAPPVAPAAHAGPRVGVAGIGGAAAPRGGGGHDWGSGGQRLGGT